MIPSQWAKREGLYVTLHSPPPTPKGNGALGFSLLPYGLDTINVSRGQTPHKYTNTLPALPQNATNLSCLLGK